MACQVEKVLPAEGPGMIRSLPSATMENQLTWSHQEVSRYIASLGNEPKYNIFQATFLILYYCHHFLQSVLHPLT